MELGELKEYPLLYSIAKESMIRNNGEGSRYTRDNTRITYMEPWSSCIGGSDFWSFVYLGKYELAINIKPELEYLFYKAPRNLEITNNGLCG